MNKTQDNNNVMTKPTFINRLIALGKRWYLYAASGVWSDTRRNWRINLMKTANLSVRSFLNANLQIKAGALTYQTMLAIVPALALMFAICRGFGFSNLLKTQLFSYFPAQQEALGTAFQFVDSYLAQSSEGVFVGIGIIFLLWTLISLISNVENAFNSIWGLQQGRSFWRKLTDYTAIMLILPILMICSSGINVLMSTTLQQIFSWDVFTPVVSLILDFSSLALVWLFFTGTYMLIPNTKVKFKNAFVAGIIAGTAFMVIQWLFVSGQIYVTKYNAIYGSFAFLPLLLIWMQLVWLITLSGAVYCYSSQNIFEFSFSNQTELISENYRWRITVAIMTIAVERFLKQKEPMNDHQISETYGLPISLVTSGINLLIDTGLLMRVINKPGDESYAIAPAIDPTTLSLGELMRRMSRKGSNGFIPRFDDRFSAVNSAFDLVGSVTLKEADEIMISSLKIQNLTK